MRGWSIILDKEQEERHIEEQHLDGVLDVIDGKEDTLEAELSRLRKSVIALRQGFWEDVTVNIDEVDDAIETEASIKQQAELLAERERSHALIDEELKVLRSQKDSPYFGRIDFLEDGEREVEALYIGLASLMDEENHNFLVYDWRAPISSLYYDYAEGPASFTTDFGEIAGHISLKRQYLIEQGELVSMFDTGITIGDQLLQQTLGHNASSSMKSIVATIQAEQNKIIRNEESKHLIVQGVAGSGKTSAALQRVAYLLYRHRRVLHEDNMVLFSPNPLFNSYVSNVLPELGEENMRQTTFLSYLSQHIEEEFEVESPHTQMEYILTQQDDPDYDTKLASIDFKSSLEFKTMIDNYLLVLEEDGLQFKDVVFRERLIVSHEELETYFYTAVQEMSLPNAVSDTAEFLLERLDALHQVEKHEDWAMDQVELLDQDVFLRAAQHAQKLEDQSDFYDSSAEEAYLLDEVVTQALAPLRAAIQRLEFVDVLATYQQLFTAYAPQEKPEMWGDIRQLSVKEFDYQKFTFEDATPYVYFKSKLLGSHTDRSVRYLFVDEAQDYTAFQLAYIKEAFPYTRMTFLGDVNQAIYAHTQEGNPLQADFKESYERIELTKSYRSTKEIVEFTKPFSPSGENIESFERHGHKPKLVYVEEEDALLSSITETIADLQADGQETIAIICKTFAETHTLHEQLKDHLTVTKIHEQSADFQKGVLILPIYLAKGIEFDAVIIPDASDNAYHTTLDQSLFYTACTRAMHDLVLFTGQPPTRYLNDVPEEKYTITNLEN